MQRLHAAWLARQPVVVALGLDPALFREPQSFPIEPWRATPESEPWFDRLHFLTWANTYDARAGDPVWWWAVKAARLDDAAAATPDGPADITLPDGTPAWVDGGPRMPAPDGLVVVHSDSVDLGSLATVPAPDRAPSPIWRPTSSPRSPTSAGRPGSSPRPAPARPASSPSACATSTATGATSGRPSSPSPTTSRPSWRWSPARPTSGPASAR